MSLNSWISQAVQGALHDNLQAKRRHWDKGGWGHDSGHGEPPSSDQPQGGSKGDDDEGGSGVSGWVRG
jgi:hypothetical protein